MALGRFSAVAPTSRAGAMAVPDAATVRFFDISGHRLAERGKPRQGGRRRRAGRERKAKRKAKHETGCEQ